MSDKDERFVLQPGKSVGSISFGQPIEEAIAKAGLVELEYDEDFVFEDVDGRDFVYPDDPYGDSLIVYEDEEGDSKEVRSVHCLESLVYEGRELIGMTIDELTLFLGQGPDEIDADFELSEDDIQTVYEFDALGLQIWAKDGRVDAIFAGEVFADDD